MAAPASSAIAVVKKSVKKNQSQNYSPKIQLCNWRWVLETPA